MERLLTLEDVAERLQVSRHRAGDYMRQMQCIILPGGGRRRVTEQAFAAWLRQHTEQPVTVHRTERRRAAGTAGDWWNEKKGSA